MFALLVGDPGMIMTQEQAILKGQRQFGEMATFVQQAARDGRPIEQV